MAKQLKKKENLAPRLLINSSPSVNSHLSNLITICRSGSLPRRISKLR